MWRYLAIATALVVAIGALVVRLPVAPRPDRASRYASSPHATPGPGNRDAGARASAIPVRGDAPWALSALPECFRQVRAVGGSAAYVRARFPRGARRVAAGATLAVADCRLVVGADDAMLTRGENAFHVPAARFFVAGDRLVLETRSGDRLTLRTYRVGRGAPRFTR